MMNSTTNADIWMDVDAMVIWLWDGSTSTLRFKRIGQAGSWDSALAYASRRTAEPKRFDYSKKIVRDRFGVNGVIWV